MKPRIKRDGSQWKCVRVEGGYLITGYGPTPDDAYLVCMDRFGYGLHPFVKALS